MVSLLWRWPWAPPAALLAVIGVLVAAWLISRREGHRPASGALSYTLEQDLRGERASAMLTRWRWLNRAAAALLALILGILTVMTARPSAVDADAERLNSRDIVLCLDVSGSTLPYDRQVIAAYLDLVRHFRGERIALSIFNSTSRTVFPLTDDYALVTDQLNKASTVLQGVQSQKDIDQMSDKQYQQISDWLEGTQNRRDATSLIGDGLVGCAATLPGFTYQTSQSARRQARPRSIILATDNVTSGTSTYSLDEALKLAGSADITVDGLFAGPEESQADETTHAMRQSIEAHGGMFLTQDQSSSVASLVRTIETRRTDESEQQRGSSLVDAPGWWTLALAVLFAGYMALAWRLRR